MSFHLFSVSFLFLAVVLRVDFAAVAIAGRLEGRMGRFEQVVEEVVFREFGEGTVVVVGQVRAFLEPVKGVLFLLRNELIAHL